VTSHGGANSRAPEGETLIRPAVADDAPAIQALVAAGFETFRAFAPPGWEPLDETRPEMVEQSLTEIADPAVLCLVAEEEGRIVGTVRLIPDANGDADHYLRHLFVAEAAWGRGLARELHDRAVAAITGTARLVTPAGQGRSRRFYEREGWVQAGEPFPEPRLGMDIVEYRR
jgi:GNAT superfamily N-acetyltransferase